MSASTGFRADESASVPTAQRVAGQGLERGEKSEQAYVASLRRSINQMKNGDVQPVREGLDELRRELGTDAKDNPLD